MADVAVQSLNLLTGEEPNYAAADGAGDVITGGANDGKLLLHIKNSDASAHTVTIDDVVSAQPAGAQSYNPDPQISVPAGGEVLVNLGQLHRFRDASGNIALTWSTVTGMTFAVLRLR